MKRPDQKSSTRFATSLAALLILGSFASCGEITTTPNQRVLHGVVTSEGLPLQGVKISGGTAPVTSDSVGDYQTNLPDGDCTIVFTKAGYNEVKKSVSADAKAAIRADIAMNTESAEGGSGGGDGGGSDGGGDTFTVSPGAHQAVRVTGPGKLSFTVVGINMDLDKDAWPIIFFYDHNGYTGGKGGSGGFNGDLRNYKLKYYNANGVITSDSYYVEPKGSAPRWDPSVARTVTLEWDSDSVTSTIDGISMRKPGPIADTFTIGIGYPPSIRNGWDNAVYTNIVWPAGATKLD